jgi:DNA primase
MPRIDFQAVRAQVSLETVLSRLGFVATTTSGAQLRGGCPIHGSQSRSSRSFSANLDKNTFRCFHCGLAGNQLDLWTAATNQPLYEATIDLCKQLGLPVPWIAN